jgi:hypothetical protein
MKRLTLLSLFTLMLLPGFAFDPHTGKTTSVLPAFTLVKSENNINIYTRWLPVDEDHSARQVKVLFSVDAPVEQVLSTLTDDTAFTCWMKGTNQYHRVSTTDSCNWLSYVRFSVPWPFDDQDCVIRYAVMHSDASYAEVLLAGEPGYLPPVEGISRISHMEGSWKLVSASPGKTLVEYVIFSKQPSSFPRWITDPIIQNNMIGTMTAFRNHVMSTL